MKRPSGNWLLFVGVLSAIGGGASGSGAVFCAGCVLAVGGEIINAMAILRG